MVLEDANNSKRIRNILSNKINPCIFSLQQLVDCVSLKDKSQIAWFTAFAKYRERSEFVTSEKQLSASGFF